MKKLLMIFILILPIALYGCQEEKNSGKNFDILDSDTWHNIVDKEWSNYEVLAGSGFYFHEEDSIAYCTLMIYGSGVRVAGYFKSVVEMYEEGIIIIALPQNLSTGFLTDLDGENAELVRVALSVDDNSIVLDDYVFEINEGSNNYEYIVQQIKGN